MSKHKVVIVGGGFGGIKAALELAEDKRFHVTLLSDRPDFRYYPSLFRTATGGKKIISSIPLDKLFENKSVHLVVDKLVAIDKTTRLLKTKKKHQLEYDAAILGLGSMTNYCGIDGLEKYSYGIKSVEDAVRLKQQLHKQLIEHKHPDLNYVVVGGGPTGVELAGVLPSYLKAICKKHGIIKPRIHVDLIEGAPRLLPRMPKAFSKAVTRHLRKLGVRIYLKTQVKAEAADGLIINGRKILSHTVIWTAGVNNNPFFADAGCQLAKNGRVRVDQYLQSDPGVYVIGDNADTPYSGMAQTALYDGKFVATNLKRMAEKKDPKPYYAKLPIYVIPAGNHWSAVLWDGVQIYGFLGWLLRRAADLIAYHDYEPFRQATPRWLAEDDSEESCPVCKDL
jgi:NADH dehydrogenase